MGDELIGDPSREKSAFVALEYLKKEMPEVVAFLPLMHEPSHTGSETATGSRHTRSWSR